MVWGIYHLILGGFDHLGLRSKQFHFPIGFEFGWNTSKILIFFFQKYEFLQNFKSVFIVLRGIYLSISVIGRSTRNSQTDQIIFQNVEIGSWSGRNIETCFSGWVWDFDLNILIRTSHFECSFRSKIGVFSFYYLESSFGSVDRGHNWFVFFWKLIFPPKFSVFILDNVCNLDIRI